MAASALGTGLSGRNWRVQLKSRGRLPTVRWPSSPEGVGVAVRPAIQHPVQLVIPPLLSDYIGALSVFVLSGTHAYADPTISDIETQLAAQWNAAEPLIEQYNAVHEQYEQNLAKKTSLEANIKPLKLQVDLAMVKVGVVSSEAYQSGPGGGVAAMLQAGSPKELADQLLYLDQLASVQEGEIQGVYDLKVRYEAAKAPIDALDAVLSKQDSDLAAQRKVIDAKIADLNTRSEERRVG